MTKKKTTKKADVKVPAKAPRPPVRKKLTAKERKQRLAEGTHDEQKPSTPVVTPATEAEQTAPKVAQEPAKKQLKPKKLSLIDAAVQVLIEANEPMNCKQMVEEAAAKELWSSPKGKTPHATLYSSILRELHKKGAGARFQKTDRGLFVLAKGA
ncbi:MAG: winged helix-turn-helix domain-containing protein [Phycisphaeraceae bacterium]|nr:winged helix-turn-helix domain-containing protein [Phycisphaeraceae bacterium]